MINFQAKSYKLIVIALGLTLAAITYWPVPYQDIRLVSYYFFVSWFFGAFIIGFLSGAFFRNPPIISSVLVLSGFILAVLLRIIYDVISNPSSHNLAGIELFITGLYVFPAALLGSLLGNFFNKSRTSKKS
jgi:ABC-type transport system involved in multi-copper enzyme maturation permease subunit